jgi:hypothetical protein
MGRGQRPNPSRIRRGGGGEEEGGKGEEKEEEMKCHKSSFYVRRTSQTTGATSLGRPVGTLV